MLKWVGPQEQVAYGTEVGTTTNCYPLINAVITVCRYAAQQHATTAVKKTVLQLCQVAARTADVILQS